MKPNFWIYANKEEQGRAAYSLISFGVEVFKRAKTIKEIDNLKKLKLEIDKQTIHPKNSNISEFIYEYLIDCIRFLIFFENYMKAELIIRDYCVHVIDKSYPCFAVLAKDQYSRPIKLKEIHDIEFFFIDRENKIINHNAIKDKTIGIKELLGSEQYYSNYNLDPKIIYLIQKLNIDRNRLHFNDTLEFQLSEELLANLETINQFVNKISKERMIKNVL